MDKKQEIVDAILKLPLTSWRPKTVIGGQVVYFTNLQDVDIAIRCDGERISHIEVDDQPITISPLRCYLYFKEIEKHFSDAEQKAKDEKINDIHSKLCGTVSFDPKGMSSDEWDKIFERYKKEYPSVIDNSLLPKFLKDYYYLPGGKIV